MPNFQYIARTTTGQQVSGVMQADDESAVARTLDEKDLFPVSVRPGSEETQSLSWLGRGRKVRLKHVAQMYQQLSDLLRAGVPVMRSLQTLERAVSADKLKETLRAVRDDVSAGVPLAEAMGKHPAIFKPLHVAMVSAGEEAGFLEDALANLATYLDRQDELQSKVRNALIYPMVLLSIGTLLVVGVLVFLIPKFEQMFSRIELPWITEALFAASTALRSRPLLSLGVVFLIGMGVRQMLRSEAGHRWWSRAKLRVPVFGKVLRNLGVTRFSRILGTLLKNGVPIVRALQITRQSATSPQLAEAVTEAIEQVEAGESLSEPLRASGFFPPDVIEMITVGEETNEVDIVLQRIADTVERRTNRTVDTAVRLMEPLILVFMAVLIGTLAIGLLYPIFTISSTMLR